MITPAQVTASLLQACYLAVIKPISGCVRIAYSDLIVTSLLIPVPPMSHKAFVQEQVGFQVFKENNVLKYQKLKQRL